MKKYLKIIVLLFMIFPINIKAIDTSATSAILMDMDSNRILYSKNIHKVRSVASISKIMTAIVAIENSNIKEEIIIGEEILKAYGSGIYIKQGEKLTVEDLLYGLMLRSGNDAALALAKYVGGTEEKFVEMMNQKAMEIGMKNSTFRNPHGLDQEDGGNLSTAYDMALLTSYAMKNKKYQKIVGTKKYTLETNMNTYLWNNKNKLLKTYKYTTGGKTGFTDIARRTLVTTASKDNINLVAVTLNDGNDFQDHKNLFEYGFENYKNYQILKKGTIQIYDDEYYDRYNLYIKNDFKYLLANSENSNIILNFKLEKKRKIKNNIEVGVIDVLLGDKVIHTEKIYLEEKKPQKKKLLERVKEWFNDK